MNSQTSNLKQPGLIISFTWTSPALIAWRKSRTRRQWLEPYARRFGDGQRLQAYDRSPRYRGVKLGDIALTDNPFLQDISRMPDEDYIKEGFAFFEINPGLVPKSDPLRIRELGAWNAFIEWRNAGGKYWVVDFEILSICLAKPQSSQRKE